MAKDTEKQNLDLHGLCNRLAEVFNEDDTPDELSTEAREAIEALWEERDRLTQVAAQVHEVMDAGSAAQKEVERLRSLTWHQAQSELAERDKEIERLTRENAQNFYERNDEIEKNARLRAELDRWHAEFCGCKEGIEDHLSFALRGEKA